MAEFRYVEPFALAKDETPYRRLSSDYVEVTEAYWFAWKAFHPDTSIWKDPGRVEGREP